MNDNWYKVIGKCVVNLLLVSVLIFGIYWVFDTPTIKQKPLTIEWVNDVPLWIVLKLDVSKHHTITITNGISVGFRSDGVMVWKLQTDAFRN